MQVRQTRKGIDELVSEPFAEILLISSRTQIQKRQDGYRGGSTFRNHAFMVFFGFVAQDLHDEAVAAPGDGLNVAWTAGVVTQRLPQLHDGIG